MEQIVAVLLLIVFAIVVHQVSSLSVREHLAAESPPIIVLVCFASDRVQNAQDLLVEEAKATGWFTDFELWNPDRLGKEIPQCPSASEEWVQENRRGYGYMTWKPFIVEHAIEKYSRLYPGRPVYVVYLDSGCQLNPQGRARFEEYLQLADKTGGVTFSFSSNTNIQWCKNSALLRIAGALRVAHKPHLISGILVFNARSRNAQLAVREWRRLASLDQGELFTDVKSEAERSMQYPQFVEHRHDQCAWSLIAQDVGFTILPDESYHEPTGWQPNTTPIWSRRRR